VTWAGIDRLSRQRFGFSGFEGCEREARRAGGAEIDSEKSAKKSASRKSQKLHRVGKKRRLLR